MRNRTNWQDDIRLDDIVKTRRFAHFYQPRTDLSETEDRDGEGAEDGALHAVHETKGGRIPRGEKARPQ